MVSWGEGVGNRYEAMQGGSFDCCSLCYAVASQGVGWLVETNRSESMQGKVDLKAVGLRPIHANDSANESSSLVQTSHSFAGQFGSGISAVAARNMATRNREPPIRPSVPNAS